MVCRRRGGILCAFPLALLLSGCAEKLAKPDLPHVLAAPSRYTSFDQDLKAYDGATGDAQRALRNKMVFGIMSEIDFVFYNYEVSLFLSENNFHVGADFAQLGLAATSTIAPAARTKTIMSALLTGVTGLNLSIDKNYFRQQTVQAIANSMEAARDKVKTQILLQLKNDTTAYPFTLARADLVHYFFAGTLSGGLQQLTQTTAADAQAQKQTADSVQVASFSSADVDCLGAINQAVAKAFSTNNTAAVVTLLDAMGSSIKAGASQSDILGELRALGGKITTDTSLRAKYCTEAKNEKFIQ